jgi:hypothetical protein
MKALEAEGEVFCGVAKGTKDGLRQTRWSSLMKAIKRGWFWCCKLRKDWPVRACASSVSILQPDALLRFRVVWQAVMSRAVDVVMWEVVLMNRSKPE